MIRFCFDKDIKFLSIFGFVFQIKNIDLAPLLPSQRMGSYLKIKNYVFRFFKQKSLEMRVNNGKRIRD